MSKQDIRVKDGHRWAALPKKVYASATTIAPGEWVVTDGSHAGFVLGASDGADTDVVHVGLAVSTSTNTAAAAGTVYVVDNVDALFVGKPKAGSTWADSLRNTLCVLDVTAGVYTIDINVASKGAFLIEDYDATRDEVSFRMKRSSNLGV